MPVCMLASVGNVFVAGFGAAAAVLIVGGFILVRLRRDRYQFDLMRTALEQGLAAMPNSIPFWLASQRQGIMILTLALALLVVGAIGYGMTAGIQPPEPQASSLTPASLPTSPEALVKPEKEGPRQSGPREIKPVPNPAAERWKQARQQRSVSLIVMGCGAVLLPLGLVRIGFARIERRYSASPNKPNPAPGS